MHYNHVSASEAGDYFQVTFEEQPNDNDTEQYFLIQREFEFDEDSWYLECPAENLYGEVIILQHELSDQRLYFTTADNKEVELTFEIPQETYQDVKRILGVIFSGAKRIHKI